MAKILSIIFSIVFLLLQSGNCFAQDTSSPQKEKVLIGFSYANTSLWGIKTNSVKKDILDKNVLPELRKLNLDIVTDDMYIKKINDAGYYDFSSVEKADLIDIYKHDNFKYLLLIEVEPIRSGRPFGYETSASVKFIDLSSNKYLYTGKIHKLTKYGGAGTVVFKIGKDIAEIINSKLSPLPIENKILLKSTSASKVYAMVN